MGKTNDVDIVIKRMISNGVVPMDDDDYDRCRFTGSQLDKIPFNIYDEANLIINNLFENCLYNFSMYKDEELLRNVGNLFNSIKIYVDNSDDLLKIYKFSSIISTKNKNDNGFFSPVGIMIPNKYNNLAHIYFTHEAHHLLKDVNPDEYKYMLKYADVIPMFYELVEADKLGDICKECIINNRLALLYNLYKELFSFNDSKNSYLSNVLKSKKFQYLNSFYYSIILFKMYKEKPDEILNLISRVLKGELSTFDMINILGIDGRDMDIHVRDELKILKKI